MSTAGPGPAHDMRQSIANALSRRALAKPKNRKRHDARDDIAARRGCPTPCYVEALGGTLSVVVVVGASFTPELFAKS